MTAIRPLLSELDRIYRRLDLADHVLVALDYDGTLAPIAATPEEAAISAEGLAILNDLAASSRYTLAIVSGRSIRDLKRRLALDAVYVGNHGLEIEGPGISFVHHGADATREAIDHACWDVEAAMESVRGVSVERKELSATVHSRQAPEALAPWIKATVEAVIHPYLATLHLSPARKAVEIRPRLHWNKGCAVRWLLDRLDVASPGLLCAGDDTTDEDMFDLLRWEVSIKVGSSRGTRARYYVREVPRLLKFLGLLAERERETYRRQRSATMRAAAAGTKAPDRRTTS
jgi:trehalose 6-phosphate phosphatase